MLGYEPRSEHFGEGFWKAMLCGLISNGERATIEHGLDLGRCMQATIMLVTEEDPIMITICNQTMRECGYNVWRSISGYGMGWKLCITASGRVEMKPRDATMDGEAVSEDGTNFGAHRRPNRSMQYLMLE